MVELLTKKFEIKHNLSMNYHPQTNGLVERFNKTLCESLAKLQEDKQWDDKIPLKEYYDSKKKRKEEFKIGNEILGYNAAWQNFKSSKLDDKWSGPYLIHEILLNGTYGVSQYFSI
ncbi:hypothetical protein RhiirB3_432033 [Rhizophagus irregularis]|nr:hypothetical protein RhiirB3_432033 [Rhizophagus irregularis]